MIFIICNCNFICRNCNQQFTLKLQPLMYESIMTLSNILSFVTILYGIFVIFYGLQITLYMSMPTLHTQRHYLIERIIVTMKAPKQALKGHKPIPSLGWNQVQIIVWVESLSIWALTTLFQAWIYQNITLCKASPRSWSKIGVKASRRSS